MSVEEALRHELEGYERNGKKDRAAQVQAALDALSAPVEPPAPVSVTDDPETAQDDPDAVDAPVRKTRKRSSK